MEVVSQSSFVVSLALKVRTYTKYAAVYRASRA